MRVPLACLLIAIAACRTATAQGVPAPIYTDPPADAQHPAGMAVLHIPSGASTLNGVLYSPPGTDARPTFVFCHGLPGNEKNLDLAQAVRRAGWNAVTFNYHGSWGTPGTFSFAQNLKDAAAVLAYLRRPEVATKLRIDTRRLVLAGHSMGGWVTAQVAARDTGLAGAVLISMGDMGRLGHEPPDKLKALMADNMEALAGVTAESMAREVQAHQAEFSLQGTPPGLARLPLLVLTSDDGLAAHTDELVSAIKAKGGTRVSLTHVATDHGWDDHRIALESLVLNWLATLP